MDKKNSHTINNWHCIFDLQNDLTSESFDGLKVRKTVNESFGNSCPKACLKGNRKYEPGFIFQADDLPFTIWNALGDGLKYLLSLTDNAFTVPAKVKDT